MSYFCGRGGRFKLGAAGAAAAVAGISEWSRTEEVQTTPTLDFESPTNSAGLPIAGQCAGPVTINYEVQGYFVATPQVGVNFSSDMFAAGSVVTADYLFSKTGPIGIKQVGCMVKSVKMGQKLDGVATFSASLVQISADPSPLVS